MSPRAVLKLIKRTAARASLPDNIKVMVSPHWLCHARRVHPLTTPARKLGSSARSCFTATANRLHGKVTLPDPLHFSQAWSSPHNSGTKSPPMPSPSQAWQVTFGAFGWCLPKCLPWIKARRRQETRRSRVRARSAALPYPRCVRSATSHDGSGTCPQAARGATGAVR
jgi:hypothetical protein